jgi:hypothetical protein
VFTPDDRCVLVGTYLDSGFSIVKVNGGRLIDLKKRCKVRGHPASARMRPD